MSEGTSKSVDFLFRAGLILKGVDAVFEVVGGILLTMPTRVVKYLQLLSQHELYDRHHKALSGHIDDLSRTVQQHAHLGPALYLMAHGLAKVILIAAIFAGKRWGYTGLIVVLSIFTVVEFGEAIFAREIVTGVLGLFDLAVVLLIAKEYKARFGASG